MTSIEFCSQLLSLEHSLLKFAYRLNLKRPDAKDLVQETFLKVLSKRDQYIDQNNMKAWTLTVMRNVFVDNYRKQINRKAFCDQTFESYFTNKTEPVSSFDQASEYQAREITQNIDRLNEKFRIPFQMYIDGYKYNEIAEQLDLKIGTVKNRIFMSRKKLISQLKEV
jgi:RNA polymerase sigma-70 factor (ECF subfamily)